METPARLFHNWKQAKEIIGIGKNLQLAYRQAGILQWTPVGGKGKKPLVFYTLGQLFDFMRYLKENPQEAARRLQEWRISQAKKPKQKRKKR